jgi:hypothetical protein
MRAFVAGGLVLVCGVASAGQFGGRTSALGGSGAARGVMSRPLGGFSSPAARGHRGAARPPIYGYSYYIPNYFGTFDSDWNYDPNYYAPAPQQAVASTEPAPQQPVIINQYFGVQGPPAPESNPEGAANPNNSSNDTQVPGGVIGTPEKYYLIAYKDHVVYSALAYWVEDKTLHYVTLQNTHNQASLDLIDLDLTKTLNQARDVPFSIPGRQ